MRSNLPPSEGPQSTEEAAVALRNAVATQVGAALIPFCQGYLEHGHGIVTSFNLDNEKDGKVLAVVFVAVGTLPPNAEALVAKFNNEFIALAESSPDIAVVHKGQPPAAPNAG